MAASKPGAGRKRAAPKSACPKRRPSDKAAAEREYADRALAALAKIMENGESEAARVAAAKSVLDRCGGEEESAPAAPPPPVEIKVKFV